jgi:hypothetical protein
MEQALLRRRELEPDIVLGQLELWIGVGANFAWPWIDVAVRIGKGWGVFLDLNGPLVQRPDFATFVPALRAFAEGQRDDALLGSYGGSMRITLRRDEHGALRGEAWFQHAPNSQSVLFSIWEGSLQAAVARAEEALERVMAARTTGWLPTPARLDLLPRATDLEPPAKPQHFEAWDSGLVPDGELTIDYFVDGYGWYEGTVQVGEKRGEFGGSWLSDAKGDLLRAGLALLAGQDRAEVLCHGEPGLTRIEFATELLRTEVTEENLPSHAYHGVWIRIRELDHDSGADRELLFEALCRSPRAVAEAIYRMALKQFEHGAGFWSNPMAALEGALATVPLTPGD